MFLFWGFFLVGLSLVFFLIGLFSLVLMNVLLYEYMLWEMGNLEIKLYFLVDWMSMMFLAVVLFISGMVVVYSEGYMEGDKNKIYFLYGVLLFVASMVMLIVSPNMIMILLGWDGLGLVSYCLVIFYQNYKSENAGMITVLSNRVGDVMILLSIVLLLNFGSLDFFLFKSMMGVVGLFLIVAGMTKSAQIPFAAWLPMAMAAPTPVSSLVHSSTLVTAGVYLLIRLSMLFEINMYSKFLLSFSFLTMFMSGLGALLEMDLKKVIALSTLSQLGLMMVILAVGMKDLSFFHLLTHAMFKATLFLCAGLMIHNSLGGQDIRFMGGYFYSNPLISGMFGLVSFSLFGLPFLSGFYSSDAILEFIYSNEKSLMVIGLLVLSTLTTCMYSLRLLYYSVWSGVLSGSAMLGAPFIYSMEIPILVMGGVVVFFGSMMSWVVFPYPILFFLKLWIKEINLVLLLLAFWWFFFGYFDYKLYFLKIWGSDFCSSLWFLSWVTSLVTMKAMKGSNFYSKMELEWMEEVGPSGLHDLNTSVSKMVQWFQMSDVFLYMLFLVFYLYLMIIF
uniref:NADH-ubiquinone oxidoreductase chain 5 n=1 Tax=Ogadenus brumpti TaxID=1827023 RepID=A0A1P8AG03_9ACAR|nr:NADH dehydrogenase subunit 5 [Ogadenus brumpti]AMX74047.1 NADH dehydrogenase subunit 5 [Ogadenus brumpti]AMX74060.1 NADH dehydrogenase subunit 5 [Ogadenus brumpti]